MAEVDRTQAVDPRGPAAERTGGGGALASVGIVVTAFLGALCCIGPLLFVTFGVGAGLASTFEPLRPLFGVIMAGALGLGFYTVYGPARRHRADGPEECALPGGACRTPRGRTRDEALLWSATVVALVLWTFPTWSTWLI